MASDNTISKVLPRADVAEPDNTVAKSIPQTSVSDSEITVTETSACKNISDPDNTCAFFRIPRELRDQIYDLIFQEIEQVDDGHHYRIRTTLPSKRLISHQFMIEYDERPIINNFFEISKCDLAECGCPCAAYDRISHPFPWSLLSRTTDMHINTVVHHSDECVCVNPAWGLAAILREWHRPWPEMPLLKKTTFSISCSELECVMALPVSRGVWPELPGLSQITLLKPMYERVYGQVAWDWVQEYREADMLPPHSAAFYEGREAISTWTPAQGWQADAEVIERCRKEEAERDEVWRCRP
jgi:hypothetical protein